MSQLMSEVDCVMLKHLTGVLLLRIEYVSCLYDYFCWFGKSYSRR